MGTPGQPFLHMTGQGTVSLQLLCTYFASLLQSPPVFTHISVYGSMKVPTGTNAIICTHEHTTKPPSKYNVLSDVSALLE